MELNLCHLQPRTSANDKRPRGSIATSDWSLESNQLRNEWYQLMSLLVRFRLIASRLCTKPNFLSRDWWLIAVPPLPLPPLAPQILTFIPCSISILLMSLANSWPNWQQKSLQLSPNKLDRDGAHIATNRLLAPEFGKLSTFDYRPIGIAVESPDG